MSKAPASIKFGELKLDPVALGSQGNAILGIRDSGKTYTAMLLAEGLFTAGIPFIAFDPIGVWRFLRVPGAGRGYPVVVAGGVDGDLPLTPAAVPALVQSAMKNGVSLVIDLFDINLSKADWRRIVMSALRTLLHENQQYGLRHVFIEEAAEFAPQKVIDGHVYAEMEKLARMGGNARLGYTLINQRAEEVNKALLELCDNLFLHRQKGRNSLQALAKWLDIGNVADHKAIIETLSTLPTGECWAWLQGSDTPIRTKVPAKNSFHPDRRVMRGEGAVLAKPVDVGAFVASMRSQFEVLEADARANDPKELKAQIARLTAELRKAERAKANPPTPPEPVVKNADELTAARQAGLLEGIQLGIDAALGQARAAIGNLKPYEVAGRAGDERGPRRQARSASLASTPASAAAASPAIAAEGITGPQQRILNALGWWIAFGIDAPTSEQVAFMAGYSASSSGYANLKGAMRGLGLIAYPAPGLVSLTEDGAKRAISPDVQPTRSAFHDAVRAKLSGPQQRILGPLLEAYPASLTSAELAARAEYSPSSSGYANLKGSMRSLGFLDYPSPSQVRAADWLFPGGARP